MLEKLWNMQKLIVLQTALSAHYMGSLTNLKCYFLFVFFYIFFWQGEKGFMTVYTHDHTPPLRERRSRERASWEQTPGNKNSSRSHGDTQHSGLLLLTCSVCRFLPWVITTCNGLVPPVSTIFIMKMSYRPVYRQILYKCFLNWNSLYR